MKKQFLTSALGAALLLVMPSLTSIGYANPISSLRSIPQDKETYKFTDGALQFAVPAGWTVKAEKDSVKLSPKSGYAQIALVALPDAADLSADDKTSLFNTLAEKTKSADGVLGIAADGQKMGGMSAMARPFEDKNNGRAVQGLFLLLSGDKVVFIVMIADKAAGDAVEKDMSGFLESIAKIQ